MFGDKRYKEKFRYSHLGALVLLISLWEILQRTDDPSEADQVNIFMSRLIREEGHRICEDQGKEEVVNFLSKKWKGFSPPLSVCK